MEKAIIGIVDTPEQAATAVDRLESMGIEGSAISVLFPDRRGSHDFAFESSSKWPEGGLAGAAIGFGLGVAIGVALGLGVFTAPAVGVLTAGGPILAALAGAAAGALLLGLIGAVIGLTIPEIQAKHYAGKVTRDSILVGVHVRDGEEARRAREVLRSVDATTVNTTGEAAVPASARASATRTVPS